MKLTIRFLLIAVALSLLSCQRSPNPFDFAFSGDASGAGLIVVDRLSSDRTEGIIVQMDLMPKKGTSFEDKYVNHLRDQGSLHLSLDVDSSDPEIVIRVYTFTNPISGFAWHHHSVQQLASRCWTAETGSVIVDLKHSPTPNGTLIASTSLSNVVFTAEGQRKKHIIGKLSIPDVTIGGNRL